MTSTPTTPPPGEAAEWRAPGGASAALPVDKLRDALDDLDGLALSTFDDSEITTLLDTVITAASRLSAQTLRLAAEADRRRLGDEIGARTTGTWLATRLQVTRPEAHRLVALGRDLDDHLHAPIQTALAAGLLRTDQADVIVRALAALPRDLDHSVRLRARDHLLELAAHHDARALRRLGKRILDVVAPEIGEAHEAALLAKEEAAAHATASFTMVDDGHGRCHGRFVLPSYQGRMLEAALLALANPKRHHEADLKDASGAWKSMPERLGSAFGEYVERFPTDGLPEAGGVNATVVVTVDLDTLMSGLGTASLDNGDSISAGTARRLACEAGLLPVVLSGASVPLDAGRTQRFHSRAMRVAMATRDRGCTEQDCHLPPAACHAHHDQPWSRGGRTDVSTGRLLCPRHHRLAHHSGYDMHRHADNSVTFHRRT